MKEVAEDEDSSDISGYHSDSDSAIMMSGNSPYVTKRARHNFISRSGNFNDIYKNIYLFLKLGKYLIFVNL